MVLNMNNSSTNKKLAFTIENLAKSSRDESGPTPPRPYVFHGVNTSIDGLCFGQLNSTPLTKLPNIDRLTPCSDPGYKSLTGTPTKCIDETRKRRRCSSESEGTSTPSSCPQRPSSSSTPSDVSSDSYTSDTDDCSDDLSRKKKARTAFSSDQVYGLEQRYQLQKYVPSSERSKLAKKLKLTDQQVKTWFQNRRMKEKRHQRDEEQTRNFYLPTGGVDIAQLHALGLPCPPPYYVSPQTVGNVFGSPGSNTVPGRQFQSPVHVPITGPSHERAQVHPGYFGYSPIISSPPVFSGISQITNNCPIGPLTSTPFSKSHS